MSVRRKLLLLIGLCVLPLAAASWVLSRALEREEADDALARARAGEKAFEISLDDDVARLQIAVRMLTTDPDVARALEPLEASVLEQHVAHFGQVWPGLRVLIADAKGNAVATSVARARSAKVPVPPGPFAGMRKTPDGGWVYAVGDRVALDGRTLGAAYAAFPLDAAWLEKAQERHRLGLVFSVGGQEVARSSAAPRGSEAEVARVSFAPKLLDGPPPATITASLDLSEQVRDHQRYLWYRLLAVALVGVVALAVGARIARRMHASITALEQKIPQVAEGRYLPVEVVRTGDELQRLAEMWNRICAQMKEAELWKRALGKYLSRAALEAVKKGDLQLGGTTLPATVLFSDIRGFTTLAERMPPEELLRILNRYFTEMVGAVIKHEGIVDKFIGDAIMAVWGPPTPGKNDAALAIRAAREMRTRLAALNADFRAHGQPELHTGIGIHSGPVVAGNIGAEGDDSQAGKMEYTVIGDTVNLASRLESLTKEMKVDVLVSEDTVRLAGAAAQVEPLSEVKVRGRDQLVQVYRLLA